MAIKLTFFVLAFLLLATQMVSSVEDVDNTENEHHHHAKGPAKAPVHVPTKAPVHSPAKAPAHSPAKAPVHSLPKSPAYPPIASHTHGCVPMCVTYCMSIKPRRGCMKTCTACCAKCKCVPDGSKKCKNWDEVRIRGKMVKCP